MFTCVGLMYSTKALFPFTVTLTPSSFVGIWPPTKSEACQVRTSPGGARRAPSIFTHVLGAMAGLLGVLFARLNRLVDMINALNAGREDAPADSRTHAAPPAFERRVRLLARAVEFTVIGGVLTACLVIEGFAAAFLRADQAYGAAILFMLAMGFFVLSLLCLLIEVRIAMRGQSAIV